MQHLSQAVVTHTFNPKTWETKPGAPLILRPAWSIKQVPGQTGLLHRETLCQPPPPKKGERKAGAEYLKILDTRFLLLSMTVKLMNGSLVCYGPVDCISCT